MAAVGALAALLVSQLGILDLLPWSSLPWALFWGMSITVGLGALRAGFVAVAATTGLLIVYLLIVFTTVIDGPAGRWTRADPRSTPFALDAVVVLSSGVKADSSLDVAGLDRLLTGLALFRESGAGRLVTTEVNRRIGDRDVSTESDQRRLIALARAESAWLSVGSVRSTRDEAVLVARLLLPEGASRIAVVTSPLHTRRACATFESIGFSVFCVPAREHQDNSWHPASGSERLTAFRAYLYERLGMVKYRSSGWLEPAKTAKSDVQPAPPTR